MSAYYMPAPYIPTSSAGWTQVASSVPTTIPAGGSAVTPAFSAMIPITAVSIPAGATYGFYVGGTTTIQYSTATATGPAGSVIASDGIISITSGHGGTFGVMKQTHLIANKVGKLTAKINSKKNNKYMVSDCPLAGKHLKQLEQDTKISNDEALHPIELIAKAYRL